MSAMALFDAATAREFLSEGVRRTRTYLNDRWVRVAVGKLAYLLDKHKSVFVTQFPRIPQRSCLHFTRAEAKTWAARMKTTPRSGGASRRRRVGRRR